MWVCWRLMGVLGFDFGFRVSEICLFFVHPWCGFLWYNFFHFSGQCVASEEILIIHCCSIYRFYWLSDRCRSGFALWWFLSEKSCRHKLVVFTGFWSWLLNVSSVLTTKKYSDNFFWVVNMLMRFGYADGSWEY